MNRIVLAFALVVGLAVPVGGCTHTNSDGTVTTGFAGFIANVGNLIGGGSVTAAETHTIAGATKAATGVMKIANAYQVTDQCDVECSATITEYSEAIRGILNRALDANKAGNSAAVAAALDAFNVLFPKFKKYLTDRGVAVQ